MKKGLLSLLALALTVVGCQNYDDQFDALTELIEGVQSDVDGLSALQSELDALEATISGLATAESVQGLAGSISDIEDDVAGVATSVSPLAQALTDLEADVAALQTAIDNAADADDVAALTSQLNAVQADLDELLAANNVIEQDITIKSIPTLEYVESLISTGTDAPLAILNKKLTVNSTFAKSDASLTSRINAITAKIKTVLGAVSVTHSASSTIDFPALTFADDDVYINTANTFEALSTVTGELDLDVEGAIVAGALTSAGTVVISPNITSLDMTGVTIDNTLHTKGQGSKTISAAKATGAINAGSAVVTRVIADKATSLTLGYTSYEAILDIDADKAATISIAAKTAGEINIDAPSSAVVTIDALTKVGTITTDEIEDLSLAKLATVSQSINATVDGDLNVPELTKITDASSIAKLETFDAPKLSMTNTLTLADAETVVVKNIAASQGDYTAATNRLVAGDLVTFTIKELGATRALYINAEYAKLEDLTVTGKVLTSPTAGTQTASIVVTTGAAALDSITLDGQIDAIDVQNGADITDFTTAETAQIRYVHLKGNSALVNLTLGHAHIDGSDGAELHFLNNDKVTGLTATNFDEAQKVIINGNAKLAALSFPSLDTKINSTSAVISVTDNALTGTYVSATASSATNDFRHAKIKSNDLLDLANYIALYSTGTPTFEFALSSVNSQSQTPQTGAIGGTSTYTKTLANMVHGDTVLQEEGVGTASQNVSNTGEASYFIQGKGSVIAE